jgi:hypothetical protein
MVGDGLTCLTFGACTMRHITRWARIVEESGWLGMVSHVSHSVHVPPKEHIYKGGPRIVEDSPG